MIKSITRHNLKTWPLLHQSSLYYGSVAPFGTYTALMSWITEIYFCVQHSFINSTCIRFLRDTKHNMRTYNKQKAICNISWIKSHSSHHWLFFCFFFLSSLRCHPFLFSDPPSTFRFLLSHLLYLWSSAILDFYS